MKSVMLTLLIVAVFLALPDASASAQEQFGSDSIAVLQAKAMELAQPGPEHQLLQALVGKWVTEVKVWMEAGADAMNFTGTSENEMILGGRFLQINSISGVGGCMRPTA